MSLLFKKARIDNDIGGGLLPLSVIHKKLREACKEDDLDTVQAIYLQYGHKVLTGVLLGLASDTSSKNVFKWLIEKKCPVDNETWLYCSSEDNILDCIEILQSLDVNTRQIEDLGLRACECFNKNLLEIVVSRIGWKRKFLKMVINQPIVSPSEYDDHYDFFLWVMEKSGRYPWRKDIYISIANMTPQIRQFICSPDRVMFERYMVGFY